jgi:hypothetical protein
MLTAVVLVFAAAIVVTGVTGGQSTPAAANGRPLATAFLDSDGYSPSTAKRMRAAGATFARLLLWWPGVAPAGDDAPARFAARDPNDPQYNWQSFDAAVRATVSAGLQPIVDVHNAPAWARANVCSAEAAAKCRPTSAALADFATAAARRYRGGFRGLPRVRYWQVWNEPNLSIELMPQVVGQQPVSADAYRDMVNAVAKAVHGVHEDNVVVAGGLAPFGGDLNDPPAGGAKGERRVHPMEFMRRFLCMSAGPRPEATCRKKVEFDVWAHHPYTYGGPTHKAFDPDDVSIGDLHKMTSLLNAAERAGHIRSSRPDIGFWVTEFSYDSQPGDPNGLSPELHARWVSEALYSMWSDGVSLVTWFLLDDRPYPADMYQSGLWTADGKPKLALQAFRFPFVAFRQKNGEIRYWGRTPAGARKTVVVEQQRSSWKRVATPQVDRYGIFQGRVPADGDGSFRARLTGRSEASLPFSLDVPADFRFCPWGSFC